MSFDCIRSVRAARACNFYHVTDEPDEPSRPSVLGARTHCYEMLRRTSLERTGVARGSEGGGFSRVYPTADP
jgi:hypothetical protein